MKQRLLLRSALLAACLLPALSAHPQSPSTSLEGRVIVRFKADTAQARIASASDRMEVLARGAGLSLNGRGRLREDTQVVTASGLTSAELAQRLSANPNVAAVEVDQRMYVRALPNDPMFSQQWHLQALQPAAINAQSAWDQTTGAANVVVAVIDTGVRPDHEDLTGKLLPGYDFVSCDSPGVCSTANDGDDRDADPSDPGDWETVRGTFYPSSWHGTRVSSIIAGNTNNARGIAGVAWGSRILPVRALGIGGGYISDIAAAMRWAAGLPVPGVPNNPNPAKVINLSLGGSGTCSSTYQSVVDEIGALGSLVVAAAGNSDGGAVEQPANCVGVLAVAGLRHVGTKVGYSSIGPEVGIAAPAGNCVNVVSGQQCLYPIDAATNQGVTSPGANAYTKNIYPDANVGTSFSAPQVAGVVALMLAQNPAIPPAKLIERIKASARAFPKDAALPTCPTMDAGSQCNCTTATCGAGMLDAVGAVTQALRPVARFGVVGSNVVGQTLSLDGSTSAAAGGAVISTYAWSVDGAAGTVGNASAPNASLALSAPGSYAITLTVTDSQGRSDSATQRLDVSAAASAANSGSGGGGGSLPLWGVLGALALAGGLRLQRRGS